MPGETRANPNGCRLVHAEVAVTPSPSGLRSQHIVTAAVGATSHFVGQQWLRTGDRVYLHTHPCEESLTWLHGVGEVTLGDDVLPVGPGMTVFIPAGVIHGFRNTGNTVMHVMIVFPVPYFADTTIVEERGESAGA